MLRPLEEQAQVDEHAEVRPAAQCGGGDRPCERPVVEQTQVHDTVGGATLQNDERSERGDPDRGGGRDLWFCPPDRATA